MDKTSETTVHLSPIRLKAVRMPLVGQGKDTNGGGGIKPDTHNLLLADGGRLMLADGGHILLATEVVKQLNI